MGTPKGGRRPANKPDSGPAGVRARWDGPSQRTQRLRAGRGVGRRQEALSGWGRCRADADTSSHLETLAGKGTGVPCQTHWPRGTQWLASRQSGWAEARRQELRRKDIGESKDHEHLLPPTEASTLGAVGVHPLFGEPNSP